MKEKNMLLVVMITEAQTEANSCSGSSVDD
jgi:hypothetical protein